MKISKVVSGIPASPTLSLTAQVKKLKAEGKLPAFKLGGTWRFRRSDLDEWIAANLTNKDSGASN